MADGTLYLVATPLGNLEEMTPRALASLEKVDLIAAEDTRVTAKICRHFDLDRPLTAYHKHNEGEKSEDLLALLREGKDLALVTDAGMPAISDPGQILVDKAQMAGIQVLAVGSGSALIHALAVSGLPSRSFTFLGFLPKDKGQKKKYLTDYVYRTETLILYVSPHALLDELALCQEILGDRPASLSREMTKWYEETKRGALSEILAWARKKSPKGEMVLVVAGGEKASPQEEEGQAWVRDLLDKGLGLKDACQLTAKHTGLSRRLLYNRALEEKRQG